jgi:general secretion pathway protein G
MVDSRSVVCLQYRDGPTGPSGVNQPRLHNQGGSGTLARTTLADTLSHRIPKPNTPNMSNRKKHQAGFTLVEILVVIVILGLLATIVGTNVIKNLSESEESIAQNQVLQFKQVVDEFIIKERRLPESFDELITENEKGYAYIEGLSEVPMDPWNNPYEIRPGEGRHKYEIVSYGPDAQPDTEDDISSKTAKDRKK